MQLLHIFDKHDYTGDMPHYVRNAVRAVIIKDGQIALVKSQMYGYYKFPGGGIENGESLIDALERETREETGLNIVRNSIREFGVTKEIRKGIYDNEIFEQYSYYYFAEAGDSLSGNNLDEYEELEGYHLEFVPLTEALRVNETLAKCTEMEFILREIYVMRLLDLSLKSMDSS